mgnify:FL=1
MIVTALLLASKYPLSSRCNTCMYRTQLWINTTAPKAMNEMPPIDANVPSPSFATAKPSPTEAMAVRNQARNVRCLSIDRSIEYHHCHNHHHNDESWIRVQVR